MKLAVGLALMSCCVRPSHAWGGSNNKEDVLRSTLPRYRPQTPAKETAVIHYLPAPGNNSRVGNLLARGMASARTTRAELVGHETKDLPTLEQDLAAGRLADRWGGRAARTRLADRWGGRGARPRRGNSVILAGNCGSACDAMTWAERYPDRVAAVIALNPNAKPPADPKVPIYVVRGEYDFPNKWLRERNAFKDAPNVHVIKLDGADHSNRFPTDMERPFRRGQGSDQAENSRQTRKINELLAVEIDKIVEALMAGKRDNLPFREISLPADLLPGEGRR